MTKGVTPSHREEQYGWGGGFRLTEGKVPNSDQAHVSQVDTPIYFAKET